MNINIHSILKRITTFHCSKKVIGAMRNFSSVVDEFKDKYPHPSNAFNDLANASKHAKP